MAYGADEEEREIDERIAEKDVNTRPHPPWAAAKCRTPEIATTRLTRHAPGDQYSGNPHDENPDVKCPDRPAAGNGQKSERHDVNSETEQQPNRGQHHEWI